MRFFVPLALWALVAPLVAPLVACGDDTAGADTDTGTADKGDTAEAAEAAETGGTETDTANTADTGDTTDTGSTGPIERPVVTGCATDTRPSGQFGCTVDYGDGKGFVESAYCLPSDPGVKPGDWGYRACGECSKGTASPAIVPGVWKGTATLTAVSKTLQQISGGPLELPLALALSNAPGTAPYVKIVNPRALRSSVCIDTESERKRPGQALDGWTTVFDPATGAFRATVSSMYGGEANLDVLQYFDILIDGVVASDQCVIAWMRLFISGLTGCPSAIEYRGPVALALTTLEAEAGVPDATTPCLDLDKAAQPGPGTADPFVPSHCPSAPAYKEIIASYENPVMGGKGWPACEGYGYCDRP